METISRKKFIAAATMATAGMAFGLNALGKDRVVPEVINDNQSARRSSEKI